MRFAVVLGYWLNNDGTPAPELLYRMKLTKEMYEELHPDKIVLSGGIANMKAGISESEVMRNILVNDYHMDKELFILENKSTTTRENAIFTSNILKEYEVDELIIVSSLDHFTDQPYNTIKYFTSNLTSNDVTIMIYTKKI